MKKAAIISVIILAIIAMSFNDLRAELGYFEGGFFSAVKKPSNGKTADVRANFWVEAKDSNSHFGAFAFMSSTGGWNEGYIGPLFSPLSALTFYVGLGSETSNQSGSLRSALGTYASWDKFSLSGFVEYGRASGFFYTGELLYHAAADKGEAYQAGIMARRYHGIGPMIYLKPINPGFSLSLLYDPESGRVNALAMLRYHF